MLEHVVRHPFHDHLTLTCPITRVGAVGQQVVEVDDVASVAFDHHLRGVIRGEQAVPPLRQHIGQRQVQRVVTSAREIDDLNG